MFLQKLCFFLHIFIDYAQKTLNIMSKKIAIFASGSGSNAENIVSYFDSNTEFEFPLIISNKIDAFVHERAKKLKIPSFTFSKNEFEDGVFIVDLLKKYEIDGIVLAGFLLKVPKVILEIGRAHV